MGIFDRWKKQGHNSLNSDSADSKAKTQETPEKKYGFQWTQEEKVLNFIVPREIENKDVSGREILSYGNCLSVIVRRDNRYHLLVDMMCIDDATITAAKILTEHPTIAYAATRIHLGLLEYPASADAPLKKKLTGHLEQQARKCTCNKHGFRDFSCGRLTKRGTTIIEYKCIYCGKTETFEI